MTDPLQIIANGLVTVSTHQLMSWLESYLQKEAVERIGEEEGYAFVLNTDGNTLPDINPMMGTDITEKIKEASQ